jgi:hypothetical protein
VALVLVHFLIMNLVCHCRPPWHSQMTVEELDVNERRAFLVWRRNLARLVQRRTHTLLFSGIVFFCRITCLGAKL